MNDDDEEITKQVMEKVTNEIKFRMIISFGLGLVIGLMMGK